MRNHEKTAKKSYLRISMASFRRLIPKVLEENGDLNLENCEESVDFVDRRYESSPGSSSYINDDNESNKEDEPCEEHFSQVGQALEEQGSVTLKRKRRKVRRKAIWEEEVVNDIVDIICEKEYFRK